MKRLNWRGVGVALVTPFRQHKVDWPALAGLIEHVLQGGASFVVCLGTTGEAITLSPEETSEVLQFTVAKVAGRVPVIAGFFGDNYTERLTSKLKHYDLSGVDAVMSSSPSYNKPTQEGIYRHYMAVADASPLPVIIYNVPSRTASLIQADTIVRLAHSHSRFLGVKDASGDVSQAMRILKERPEGFLLWSGDDVLTLPLIACGADGAISVIANAFPAEFCGMVRACIQNDWARARHLNDLLLDIHPYLYAEGNPAGVKAVLQVLGWCSREVRLPLTPATPELVGKIEAALAQLPALQASASVSL